MFVNITQQRTCLIILQQMLYFSQYFADKFYLENACCVMFMDICCHLTDMTFLGAGTAGTKIIPFLENNQGIFSSQITAPPFHIRFYVTCIILGKTYWHVAAACQQWQKWLLTCGSRMSLKQSPCAAGPSWFGLHF